MQACFWVHQLKMSSLSHTYFIIIITSLFNLIIDISVYVFLYFVTYGHLHIKHFPKFSHEQGSDDAHFHPVEVNERL